MTSPEKIANLALFPPCTLHLHARACLMHTHASRPSGFATSEEPSGSSSSSARVEGESLLMLLYAAPPAPVQFVAGRKAASSWGAI